MQNKWAQILIIVFIVLFISTCKTTYNTVDNRNLAAKYNPAGSFLHPEYFVYQKSDTSYRLYYRFFPKEFNFVTSETDSALKIARATIFYRVTNSYSSINITDSATLRLELKGKPRPLHLGFLNIKLTTPGINIIEIFLTDNFANNTVSTILEIETGTQNAQNRFTVLTKNGTPLFYNYAIVNDTFKIAANYYNNQPLKIFCYPADTTVALEPDNLKKIDYNNYTPDSVINITEIQNKTFAFNKPALLVITPPDKSIGRTFNIFGPHYPYIKTTNQMLKPLQYLCSENEMLELYKMNNPKQAIDTFWIKTTGQPEKARELIRVFYNRVQLSNYYFTDYKEGWQTDRGMLYTIYGAPSHVSIENDGEYWHYGKGSNESMKFYFYKETHPLFGTTYILDRSELYARVWFSAVESWRNGRVFSLNP